MSSIMRKYGAFTAHEKPTTGDAKMSFVSIDHLGWLRCDGRSLSKTEYGILFNVIGYTFGGSGDNFNLPNVSGVVPGIAGPTHAVGTQVGSETHTLTVAEMPAHDHGGVTGSSTTGVTTTTTGSDHTHQVNWTAVDDLNFSGTDPAIPNSDTGTVKPQYSGIVTSTNSLHTHGISDPGHTHTIASQGGGLPHNNMQPTFFIGNMFIYCGDPPTGTWPYTIPPGGGQPVIY
jgi:microcystin-dependent protein